MKIKEIPCIKSRTICVEGMLGKDKFRKFNLGIIAIPDTEEEKKDVKKFYKKVSDTVDSLFEIEIKKLNNLVKNKNQ